MPIAKDNAHAAAGIRADTNKIKEEKQMASISNAEIITNECIFAGLDPTKEYLTFMQWKTRGYSVKKGEHAVIKTGLWTPCKASKKELAENPEARARCYLKTSSLFTREQVEATKQTAKAS